MHCCIEHIHSDKTRCMAMAITEPVEITKDNPFLAPSRSPVSHFVCVSVCPFGTKLSIGLNLHLRAVWVSLRSVSGQSKVSLRSV